LKVIFKQKQQSIISKKMTLRYGTTPNLLEKAHHT